MYSMIPNIESLITYSSLAVQLKIILAMSAFFYLRWKKPHLHRPVKVLLILILEFSLTYLKIKHRSGPSFFISNTHFVFIKNKKKV